MGLKMGKIVKKKLLKMRKMGAEITKQLNKIEKKWVKNEKNKI